MLADCEQGMHLNKSLKMSYLTRAIANWVEVLTFPSVWANGMCLNINRIHDSMEDKCRDLQPCKMEIGASNIGSGGCLICHIHSHSHWINMPNREGVAEGWLKANPRLRR